MFHGTWQKMTASTQHSHWLGRGQGPLLGALGFCTGVVTRLPQIFMCWLKAHPGGGAHPSGVLIFRGKLEVLAVLWGDLGATEIPDFLSILGLEHRGFAHQLANGLQGTCQPHCKESNRHRKPFLRKWPKAYQFPQSQEFSAAILQSSYQSAAFQVMITSKK